MERMLSRWLERSRPSGSDKGCVCFCQQCSDLFPLCRMTLSAVFLLEQQICFCDLDGEKLTSKYHQMLLSFFILFLSTITGKKLQIPAGVVMVAHILFWCQFLLSLLTKQAKPSCLHCTTPFCYLTEICFFFLLGFGDIEMFSSPPFLLLASAFRWPSPWRLPLSFPTHYLGRRFHSVAEEGQEKKSSEKKETSGLEE